MLVKCSGQDEMAGLIEAEPDIYFRPGILRPGGWLGHQARPARVDWDHVARVARAQLAAPAPRRA